jgi:hypothetical protein
MRISAATQLEVDIYNSPLADRAAVKPVSPSNLGRSAESSIPAGEASPSAADSSSAPLKIPTFGVDRELYAIGARQAGRLNASAVSPNERKEWLEERQALLTKKYAGGLSRKEENRLTYVRWFLDRIEDAMYGEALDKLESSVAKYDQFRADVLELMEELTGRKSTPSKKSRKSRRRR